MFWGEIELLLLLMMLQAGFVNIFLGMLGLLLLLILLLALLLVLLFDGVAKIFEELFGIVWLLVLNKLTRGFAKIFELF